MSANAMTLTWKLKRLRAMEAREVVHRVREACRERMQKLGLGIARPGCSLTARGRPWVEVLPTQFAADEYCRAANAILEGDLYLFNWAQVHTEFPPTWNRDPKTGVVAPLRFGRTIDYRNAMLVGNIKYLWEPNRHLELVTLAQAWYLSRKPEYADGARALLESWFDQCPYPLGPNWSSSLELGIRLVNWSFAWSLLGGDDSPVFAGAAGEKFRHRWLQSVYQHCHFISSFPSLYSSANNHRLGEQLGLLVASITWPKWPESAQWRVRAQEAFEQESLLQNAADGVNQEQGIWYHHEVADMMLIAGLTGRANGLEFRHSYWKRLESMLEFIASIMDVRGNVPAFGDSDDAVMVRFRPMNRLEIFRSLLATGAVLFGRADFKEKAARFDDKSRWLLGDAAATTFASLPVAYPARAVRRAFPGGGYYVLGAEFDTRQEVRVVADAGPLGYLSIAAHGHADALSFTLSAAGNEILIDPGTFAYHTDKKWRDYFRGTSAHNTIRVDRADQSLPGGNFLWTRHARTKVARFHVAEDYQVLVASHDGYCRLSDPVTHEREMRFDVQARVLRVVDRIFAEKEHLVEMFWHVSEQCQVRLHADCALIESGDVRVCLRWPSGTEVRLACGGEAPPEGWVSRHFDSKMPTRTIVVTTPIVGVWEGVSEIVVLMARDAHHAL